MIRPARANPFRTAEIDRLDYYSPEISISQLVDRLQQTGYRAMLVGPQGSGKSTLLRAIGESLSSQFRIHRVLLRDENPSLSREERRLIRDLTSSDLLLLDGFEQLSRWARSRVLKRSQRAGGLVVTTHSITPPESLELSLLHQHKNSLGTTTAMVERVLRTPLSPAQRLRVGELHRAHGDNMRDLFCELYEDWASRSRPFNDAGTP